MALDLRLITAGVVRAGAIADNWSIVQRIRAGEVWL
ncbi:MAG: hypothetical protein QOD02_608 [Mycobacterium sp.]|jgi:hypothetical protein|nr:hypothetical protein [Mycobacterium sp.]MDT5167293.1 hypothetical protein [Mycobacterium sp.]MDT5200673.1 hypothetical protein [Mycobacterium sp.]MDT5254294.1 hypothetical protein [Mycobacterium sp.]MDT5310250.1 hypothetical protein [Mycobacterium sp.]